jgi:hypothetical protein
MIAAKHVTRGSQVGSAVRCARSPAALNRRKSKTAGSLIFSGRRVPRCFRRPALIEPGLIYQVLSSGLAAPYDPRRSRRANPPRAPAPPRLRFSEPGALIATLSAGYGLIAVDLDDLPAARGRNRTQRRLLTFDCLLCGADSKIEGDAHWFSVVWHTECGQFPYPCQAAIARQGIRSFASAVLATLLVWPRPLAPRHTTSVTDNVISDARTYRDRHGNPRRPPLVGAK